MFSGLSLGFQALKLVLLDSTTHCIQMIVSWSIFLIPCQFDVEFDLCAFEGKAVTKNCVRLKAFILLIDIPFELREHYQHGYANVLNIRG